MRQLTRSLADIQIDPEQQQAVEGSYRRGVHQALALAADLVEDAATLPEAKRLIGRAEREACRLRYHAKHEGNGMLLDRIRQRLTRSGAK
jgi:hypothetical protein